MNIKPSTACVLGAVAGLFALPAAYAAPINSIAPGSLTGTAVIDFETLPGGVPPGTNHDAIIVFPGLASFGERFLGQTVSPFPSPSGDFDVLSGTPSGPLTLQTGVPGQNLASKLDNGPINQTTVLAGLGTQGFPNFPAIGEGAIAVLFDLDQSQVGFEVVSASSQTATVSFFTRSGGLIDTAVISVLADITYAFERDLGVADIAGITVTNFDLGGIEFDNFVVQVPEPGGMTLLAMAAALGLIAGRGVRHRRRE